MPALPNARPRIAMPEWVGRQGGLLLIWLLLRALRHLSAGDAAAARHIRQRHALARNSERCIEIHEQFARPTQ